MPLMLAAVSVGYALAVGGEDLGGGGFMLFISFREAPLSISAKWRPPKARPAVFFGADDRGWPTRRQEIARLAHLARRARYAAPAAATRHQRVSRWRWTINTSAPCRWTRQSGARLRRV